jgi:transposase
MKVLRREAKKEMLREARRHKAYPVLKQIPTMGPIRVAEVIARIGSPHRFRTKRQLWTYIGLAVTTRTSAEYEVEKGQVRRRVKRVVTRGLNTNYNHRLKYVFKCAALGGIHREPFASFYQDLIRRGMRSEMAQLTLARKIAAVTLRIWKKGERFNELRLKREVV